MRGMKCGWQVNTGLGKGDIRAILMAFKIMILSVDFC